MGRRSGRAAFVGASLVVLCALACGDDGGGDGGPMTTTTPPVTTTPTTAVPTSTGEPSDTTASGDDGTTAAPVDTTGPDAPVCGDGVVAGDEQCDDGPANADDAACTAACALATCGDGLLLAGDEQCDDGPANADDAACTAACTLATCGDGHLLAGVEACDDGNLEPGDGCTAACTLESCGDGAVQAPEQCDDGDADDTDECLTTCLAAACGDGSVHAGVEACDDGNADESDACTSLCAAPACDDGLQSGQESDLDCGGPTCGACPVGAACLAPSDCTTGLCAMGTCQATPRSCKELLQLDPAAASGKHPLDLDGPGPLATQSLWCDMTTDGGGWTVFYAVTGADAEVPITSDAEIAINNPLMHLQYNLGRSKKVALAAGAAETLWVRPDAAWIKTSAPLFDATLATPGSSARGPVDLTESGGAVVPAFQGWSNAGITGGGDFGISQSPDGVTCGQFPTNMGFDNHNNGAYRMLNCNCERQYIYSYSNQAGDGDPGYDAYVAHGAWTVTQGNCGAGNAEGGALKFYAAMR
ncbi:MAG: hypothetical protein JNL82_17765 [Myxococcales bacterium]|nr:hypothetical protein [Myxococcales bacterium]